MPECAIFSLIQILTFYKIGLLKPALFVYVLGYNNCHSWTVGQCARMMGVIT